MKATIPIPSRSFLPREVSLPPLLQGMCDLNMIIIPRAGLPDLYESGIRYERQGTESWNTADRVFARKLGDCEDLANYRVAELRLRGIDASPYVYRTGPRVLHAVVKLPDGTIEDPSLKLGMRDRDALAGLHEHDCESCGFTWGHGARLQGDPRAHECPNCGDPDWWIAREVEIRC